MWSVKLFPGWRQQSWLHFWWQFTKYPQSSDRKATGTPGNVQKLSMTTLVDGWKGVTTPLFAGRQPTSYLRYGYEYRDSCLFPAAHQSGRSSLMNVSRGSCDILAQGLGVFWKFCFHFIHQLTSTKALSHRICFAFCKMQCCQPARLNLPISVWANHPYFPT